MRDLLRSELRAEAGLGTGGASSSSGGGGLRQPAFVTPPRDGKSGKALARVVAIAKKRGSGSRANGKHAELSAFAQSSREEQDEEDGEDDGEDAFARAARSSSFPVRSYGGGADHGRRLSLAISERAGAARAAAAPMMLYEQMSGLGSSRRLPSLRVA